MSVNSLKAFASSVLVAWFLIGTINSAQANNELNRQNGDIIRIALPDEATIKSASPERFQPLVNFLKEYWQIWAIDQQRKVEFHYLSTLEAIQQLKMHEIDVIAINIIDIQRSDSLYSLPYAKFTQSVFRNQQKSHSDTTRIAIHDENKHALNFLPKHIEPTYFNDLPELLAQYQKFDVLYSTRPWLLKKSLKDYGIAEQFTINSEEVPRLTLHFTTRKSDRQLMLALNDSIRQVKPAQAKLWSDKYLNGLDSKFSLTLGNYLTNLTDAEKNYVIDNNVIKFPIPESGLSPFIITRSHADITDRGLSFDLLEMVSDKLGIIFKPERYSAYKDVIDSVDNNETQLHSIIEVNKFVSDKYLFSVPYMHAHYSGVYNPNTSEFSQLSDANNHVIAIVDMFQTSLAIKSAFPKAKFVSFSTIDDALASVARGETTLFIGRSLLASSIVKKKGFANLTSIPLTNFRPGAKFSFATTKQHQTLISLLNKSINDITAGQLDSLYAKWSQTAFPDADVQGKVADAYRQASYVFFAILLIALIIFWVYYRQLQVRKLAQRKIEHALAIAESARSEAEKSAQAKISFLARMSHEIRTPMNGVLGMAEALSYSALNKDQSDLLDTLEDSAHHLLALLNDVLDFSKMDAGKLTLETVPVNLHLLAKNLMKSFHHIEVERQLDLLVNIDKNITHSYFTDPTRLNQVLNNLISNAIKFTEQGSITLSIERVGHHNDKLDIFDKLRISVKDTGIGISNTNQQRLFTPFTQADTDITRKFGGTGLGLSICHEIVSSMGGTIKINSTPGIGSEFYFELCLKEAEFEGETEDRRKNNRAVNSPQDDRFKNIRVLVAEDNLVNVKVLSAQLSRLGVEADIAYDGQQALDKHLEQPYDIIISDCHMPNMDGFELARKLNKQNDHVLWLIAVTADALSGAAEKCLDAGFDDYMAKPCPQEEITNKLNNAYRALQKKKLHLLEMNKPSYDHQAIFNPEKVLSACHQNIHQTMLTVQAYTENWDEQKQQLLIALDKNDTPELDNILLTISELVASLKHQTITEEVSQCRASLTNDVQNTLEDKLLNLCSTLDLLFVEINRWQKNTQSP